MSSVSKATEALRTALRKKVVEKGMQDAFDNLASHLMLLNSSPSVLMIQKLCAVLRQPLLPLYNTCLRPALELSSSVLSTVLGRLCDAHSTEDKNLHAAWEAVAEVILSGILDFLDQSHHANIETGGAVWGALCRIICEFFFLDSERGLPMFSISLCLSAYNTLTETVAKHTTMRDALRQRAVLGGERLGAAISRTKDYLLLEALLMLFARLLPPTHNTPQGKLKRIKFVKEVLGSPRLFRCSTELLEIVQKTSDPHWDDVAARIIDVLARTDITCPQPFSIDEIDICGHVFPQPLATDRLIMDKQAFLVNIIAGNDDPCESLQVPYSYIRTITLDNSVQNAEKGEVSIVVYLASPPLVGNSEMKPCDASRLHAKFLLQNDVIGRFMEALRRRGVGKLCFLNPREEIGRKRKSISIASGFKFTNDSSPFPPTASFEGKVQHINQVYKTDIEDITMSIPVPHFKDAGSLFTPDPKPPFEDENLIPEVLTSEVAGSPVTPTPPTNKSSNPIQKFAFPENLTGAARIVDDGDEVSEISDFEPNINATKGRVANGNSILRYHGAKPAQHKVNRTRKNEHPGATSREIKPPSKATSETVVSTEGVAQMLLEAGKSPSPIFGSSCSTKIDVSPKLMPNVDTPFATDITDGLSAAYEDCVAVDMQKKAGIDEGVPSGGGLITTPELGSDTAKDEMGQNSIPSSGVHQEIHSCIEITKNTSISSKIAGNRRKREPKLLGNPVIQVDDEYLPPRKKSREDRSGIGEDKSNESSPGAMPVFKVKRYLNAAKRTSPGIEIIASDHEVAELKSTCQGTRRSSRIKRRQAAATSGTRSKIVRGGVQKGKQTDARGMERRKKIAIASLHDNGFEISHGTPSTLGSRIKLPVAGEPSYLKLNEASPVELRRAENITLVLNSPQQMSERISSLARVPSQHSTTPEKLPTGNFGPVQEAVIGTMQLVQGQLYVETGETINDRCLAFDDHIVDELGREATECSVFLKESDYPLEPSRRIMEPTRGTEAITIDLTIDDFPVRERSAHVPSVDPVRLETDTRTRFNTPDQSDSITLIEPAAGASSQSRRRSVTFASPIEHVLNKKVKANTQTDSSSRRSLSPSNSITLSPLRISTGPKNVKHETFITSRTKLQNSSLIKVLKQDQTADGVEIEDIVEVLNEIQAVIIKGISNKFRNVKKDIQQGRDELIQQVLQELQVMVAENARNFNELLRLEEGYYKNCKTILHCWEELIDSNDSVSANFQNALKEHEQNISAKAFPKSLPLKPVFSPHRRNF